MDSILDILKRFKVTQLAGPVLIILILAMMVLPLPPVLLDIFFTFNIAVSVIVLLVGINVRKPLDFSAFPTVLLVTTLLRLSLNVASSRVILLEGHSGPDAAGKVIESFAHFLIGDNVAIGIVVFVIITIINFVVITKGAGRIAEVSARFTLDAMPGKQMAIDADLNAGLIGEDEARTRRSTIAEEANFFGAMDGASKFVRGDAMAGILIIVINILGGLIVGMVQHDLDAGVAAKTYTLLTIGDGLVAQIPALIISTAAGIVVSRVGTDKDMSEQFLGQMFTKPQVLYITAAVIGMVGLIPNMPHFSFLLIAGSLGLLGWVMEKRQKAEALQAEQQQQAAPPPEHTTTEVSWNDVQHVDQLGMEVGYRLIPLVDRSQDGELLRRIRGIRKKIAQELGFLVPPVHIRDNLEIKPNAYRILLKGVELGTGEAFIGQYLAINPGRVNGELTGTPTTDPAFGLPAIWIDAGKREEAQSLGYTVVDASTVVATHISNLLQTHAAELLGREEVQALIDHQAKESPKLIEDLVPKVVPVGTLQKVLQQLLTEGIHIRDFRTILETLADHVTTTQDIDELTNIVRTALSRVIVQQLFPGEQELPLMTLEPTLENVLMQAVQSKTGGGLEPGLAENLLASAAQETEQVEIQGYNPVLLTAPGLRPLLARFLRRALPQLRVISHNEIPDNKSIRIIAVIGGSKG
ncbi:MULTISPECIES: flagellar biosynthesis protein FlhA [Chromobacterium]|uniref:Flagellar biosynthesis protein FlhA n=2 Tax=Chromobacterium TaxID=535 RepID=A0ABS3GRF1_9NEIS|nr:MULTISPECIES: flagellar biosynthesis protein FlhA [Chromobacterium]AXT49192.1 flagellar biosynthesis protein FlhA [Chromobacterium rhizoryzae]MBK0416428.1 flagellar biosynthesis protein FlhA [Chromobacterium haemolyticum]MBO0417618.1 flagellar biosynthesis protein FlhA [Chromobacterium haemolyticum]MBO0500810.1 flagellar biosynthesis protein FlhA [Chromobacterium haemolyticum]MDH0343905.1 flagellar biosynthesis protein FlhA [Chromobacterium haemolyticum]